MSDLQLIHDVDDDAQQAGNRSSYSTHHMKNHYSDVLFRCSCLTVNAVFPASHCCIPLPFIVISLTFGVQSATCQSTIMMRLHQLPPQSLVTVPQMPSCT